MTTNTQGASAPITTLCHPIHSLNDAMDLLSQARHVADFVQSITVNVKPGQEIHLASGQISGLFYVVNSDLKLIQFYIEQRFKTDTPPLICHELPAYAGNNFSRFDFIIPAAH